MMVKVHTDASYSHKMKKGAYAYILDINGKLIGGEGVLKARPTSSSEAEAMALANALYHLTTLYKGKVSRLICYTDNMNLKNWVRNRRTDREACLFIQRFIAQIKCPTTGSLKKNYRKIVQIHHVKVHTGLQDYNSQMNQWCDDRVKQWHKILKP